MNMVPTQSIALYKGPNVSQVLDEFDRGQIPPECVECFAKKTGINVIQWLRAGGKEKVATQIQKLGLTYLGLLMINTLFLMEWFMAAENFKTADNLGTLTFYMLLYPILSLVFVLLIARLRRTEKRVRQFCSIFMYDVSIIADVKLWSELPKMSELRRGAREVIYTLRTSGQSDDRLITSCEENLKLVGIIQ